MTFEKEVNHSHLAEEVLVPNANRTDCNRLTMVDSHLVQYITITGSEPPLVYTNFENQVGEESKMGYKSTDDNLVVIAKIKRNDYNYVMIVKNKETGVFDFIERKEGKWLTEHYGFKWDNTVIDNLTEGEIIDKGDVLFKNDCYDDNMNFGFGANFNVAYFTYKNLTLEDAVVISESARDKMTSYKVNPVTVNFNMNDIPLNLYGTQSELKAFPDIGEEVVDQQLIGRRRINYDNMLYELKNLNKIRPKDNIFNGHGTVVDIKIFCNIPEEELEKQVYNEQILKYVRYTREFNQQVYELLEPLIESGNHNYTDTLLSLYNNCKMQLDKNAKFMSQSTEFNGFIIEFTLMEEQKLSIGSKITGRLTLKPSLQMVVIPFKQTF